MSFSIQCRTDSTGPEIDIYDLVGQQPDGSGVSLSTVSSFLRSNSGAKQVTVNINSSGGSGYDGVAIYNALRSFTGIVVTVCHSLAASAAGIIFLAGDKRVMQPGSSLMVHFASTDGAKGGADDLRKYAEQIDRLNQSMASIVSDRTRLSITEATEALRSELWLNPQEALSKGFATEIGQGSPKMQAKFDPQAVASFRNAPEHVVKMLTAPKCLADMVRLPQSNSANPVMAAMIEDAAETKAILAKRDAHLSGSVARL